MSDIVERLRASVTQCRAVDRSALLAEAADEIERLCGRTVRLPDDLLIWHRLIKSALDEAGVKWVEVAEWATQHTLDQPETA